MNTLRQAVEDYVSLRRALGFKLEQYEHLLTDFVAYLQAADAPTVTTELALGWATSPAKANPAWWAHRLGVVRGFARHLQALDPATEVPPADLLPGQARRSAPYLYSDADIAALMAAARALHSPLRAATHETLVGLLAVTGLRPGEAIRLDREDVEWAQGLLTIRDSKFGKSREVPLHPSTLDALRAHARVRDELCPRPNSPSFFVSKAGTRLIHVNVDRTFQGMVRRAGLERRAGRRSPRLHDLRHSFAVRTLLGWYRAGLDVQAHLPLLSTYLGHANPANTYWYLSAVPELLTLAGQRREHAQGRQP
jgi:integrase/recombinase XerD